MKRLIKNWFRRSSKRLQVHFRRFWRRQNDILIPNYPLTEIQELALTIVKKAIIAKGSELLVAPVSGTRYIHFNEIFIKIDPKLITIINGSYTYHIEISEKSTSELLNRFNFKLETVQKAYEHTILTKTKRSLNTILEDLTSNI
jgi:hypothetical protein